MRWDELTVEEQARRALPGFRDPATVRTFDAPEAMDVRFYEVRAKSAINRVPDRSRMPFRWTINPYRGCHHACTYCAGGETPILMATGQTKPLAEIRPGDTVIGTAHIGPYRRYVQSHVLDHWQTIKPAYRIVLEDGTELVASGDHRFLTAGRGWKHVTGTEQGRYRRPHLTSRSRLMGTGAFVAGPEFSLTYKRGYLCGLLRGDAHLGSSTQRRSGGGLYTAYRFRLALKDFEALRRARIYLDEIGVHTQEFEFQAAVGNAFAIRAIRTQSRDNIEAIREWIKWPIGVGEEWSKGFLAGIFDAEGSYSGSLRIANTDPEIIDWITYCLHRHGFPFVIEDYRKPNGLRCVRLLGGLAEALRFFHTTEPAISRKRDISGAMVKTFGRLRVASIEKVSDRRILYDITTSTGDFIANGVVSHNCFARPTHTYLDMNAGRDFEREIVVKVNAPELVRRELGRASWKGEHVAMGTNTDPYQWVEGRYKLMPGIWEAMRDFANPCSILTKSPLLLRDKQLLQQINERASITASFSVPTLDEKTWRATEPHTPNPRARLEAVAELNRLGIPTGILIAPLMPGINDSPEQVERIVEIATEAGAISIGGIALHLRGEVRDIFFDWLRAHRPDLTPQYEQLYARSAYAPKDVQERMRKLASRPGSPPRRFLVDRDVTGHAAARHGRGNGTGSDGPRKGVVQETLF